MWLNFVALAIVGVAPLLFDGRAANGRGDKGSLVMTTSTIKERYCSDRGTTFLEWTLNLKYTNLGLESILLNKKSSRVSRNLVSTDLKALSSQRYVYAPIPVHADLDSLGYRPTPDPDSSLY